MPSEVDVDAEKRFAAYRPVGIMSSAVGFGENIQKS